MNTDLSTAIASVAPDEAHAPSGLLVRAQRGDAEAFCDLCAEYETRLFRQALSLCRDETLAEDLAHDTFVEAWNCLERFKGKCQFFTWLCAILFNRHRNSVRAKRRRPFSFSSLFGGDAKNARDILDALPDANVLPNEAAARDERNLILRRAMDDLPARHREVVYLRFFVDSSLENIAAAVGCSVGTVKSRLFHALEKLRAMPDVRREVE